jgi:hypothetical protein
MMIGSVDYVVSRKLQKQQARMTTSSLENSDFAEKNTITSTAESRKGRIIHKDTTSESILQTTKLINLESSVRTMERYFINYKLLLVIEDEFNIFF